MKRLVAGLAVGAGLLAIIPAASDAAEPNPRAVAAPDALSEGVVKKIDRAGGKVTLAHGPIVNLAMPGMTMTFKAQQPKALEGLKEGDKVHFRAEDVSGALVVTRIEAVK